MACASALGHFPELAAFSSTGDGPQRKFRCQQFSAFSFELSFLLSASIDIRLAQSDDIYRLPVACRIGHGHRRCVAARIAVDFVCTRGLRGLQYLAEPRCLFLDRALARSPQEPRDSR